MSIVPCGTSLAVTHKRLDGAGLNINCHASGPSSEPDTLPTENMAHIADKWWREEGGLNGLAWTHVFFFIRLFVPKLNSMSTTLYIESNLHKRIYKYI